MSHRLLTLDDERFVTLIIKSTLKLRNYDVVALTDPLKVIDTLENDHFDLLITDLMMPDVSGLDLCREIRKNEKLKDIKLLLLTAKKLTIDERKEFMAMDVAILGKPFSPNVLADKINQLI